MYYQNFYCIIALTKNLNFLLSFLGIPALLYKLVAVDFLYFQNVFGGLAEWLNATVLKTVISSLVSGVRIPHPLQ